jgi:DNA repair protein RadD
MMQRIEHRPYEAQAVHDLRIELPAHKRVLAVAPTGAGKTVIATLLIGVERRWRRVLWLAHRAELIEQARQSLIGLGVPCGVRCASYEQRYPEHVDHEARVQVGSVQTVIKREVFDVDLIVIDEAHRAMADTYQQIIKMRPRAEVLGLTATPIRMDGRDLGDFFRSMLIVAKPSDLYAGAYLAQPVTYAAPPEAREILNQQLKSVPISDGDFKIGALGQAVNKGVLVGNIVSETLRLAPCVPKVVFATTIAHSRQIAERFREVGVSVRHIDSKTPPEARADALRCLANGQVEIVTCVDVLCEGWDCPALGAVIIARPTRSFARFLQMIGRVQRPGVTARKLILDHGGNAERLRHFPGEDVEWVLARGSTKTTGCTLVRTCFQCHAILLEGADACTQCGALQPKSERRVLEEREAELVELDRERIEQLRTTVRQRVARIAKQVDAPAGWAERVVNELVSRAPRNVRIKP